MRELLTLAAFELFFFFDRVMCRQIDGVVMGSPLDPILANVFLCHFEQWLSECPPDILLKVFKRYVDDIFLMFLCQSHLSDFLNQMNTKHRNFKFTSEFERNDPFSILDVKITRSNNQQLHQLFVRRFFVGLRNLVVFLPALQVYACRIHVWLSLRLRDYSSLLTGNKSWQFYLLQVLYHIEVRSLL